MQPCEVGSQLGEVGFDVYLFAIKPPGKLCISAIQLVVDLCDLLQELILAGIQVITDSHFFFPFFASRCTEYAIATD
jgi:hypothetical protein